MAARHIRNHRPAFVDKIRREFKFAIREFLGAKRLAMFCLVAMRCDQVRAGRGTVDRHFASLPQQIGQIRSASAGQNRFGVRFSQIGQAIQLLFESCLRHERAIQSTGIEIDRQVGSMDSAGGTLLCRGRGRNRSPLRRDPMRASIEDPERSDRGGLPGIYFFERGDVLQNHLNDVFITEFRVDHQVIERAVRPVGVEVVADERGTLAVDIVNELQRLFFAFADRFEAADLFIQRRVGKNVEAIPSVTEEIGRAPADDNGFAARSYIFHNLVKGLDHAVGVEGGVFPDRKRSLIASPRVYLEESVEQRVDALVAALGRTRVDICYSRDFRGQVPVPQLPSQALGKCLGDGGPAAPVFAFDRDDADLHSSRSLESVRRSATPPENQHPAHGFTRSGEICIRNH